MGAEHVVKRRVQAEAGAAAPPSYPEPEPAPDAGRFAARLLWIFAAGSAAGVVLNWAALGPGLDLSMAASLGSFVLPLVLAEAVFLCARRVPAYRGVALIGFLLAGACMLLAGWSVSPVAFYIAAGLLLWGVKLKRTLVVTGGMVALAAWSAPWLLSGWIRWPRYADYMDSGFEAGIGYIQLLLGAGVAAALVLAVLAVLQRRAGERTQD
ncbi:hypothetical protein [Zhihengliuella halotolerans]|uniref:hypothetical protein n=1 Tax=Zhihengliuella halotolerans TaxID=370736 RepID=UPI000C7FC145|nr:hypothetical protein [Zhihengliuella halotolerans]